MKQQILNLKKKLLLVEIGGKLSDDIVQIMNEHGMAEILGKLTDITENQFEQWVKQNNELSIAGCGFEDYNGTSICDTAKESFFSYLESQGIIFLNPLGNRPEPCYQVLWDEEGDAALEKWQEAEEKVWDINQCYIFLIL